MEEKRNKLTGKLVLNRNPGNYFTEVEQSAFCHGNIYRKVMKDKNQDNLIGNIVDHLGKAYKKKVAVL
ncbi:MAG: catalase [Desulfobacterales bacterium]|jgi:catalase|nr:catalase [Desulfobacterales bacterium]